MMKRSIDDYDEEEVKETGGDWVKWKGKEGDEEEEEWKDD